MKCQRCARDFVGNACPACGYPVLAMGGGADKRSAADSGRPAYNVPVKGKERKAPAKAKPKPKKKSVVALALLMLALLLMGTSAVLFIHAQSRMAHIRNEVEQAAQAGNRDEARKLLDGYVNADPDNEDIYLLYADFFLMEDDYNSALDVLEVGSVHAHTSERIVEKQQEILATYASEIQQEREEAAEAEREAEMQRAGIGFLVKNGFTQEQALAFLQAAGMYGKVRPDSVSVENGAWVVSFESGRRYTVVFADDSASIVMLQDRHGQYLIENGQENADYFSFDDIDWNDLIAQLKEDVGPHLPGSTPTYDDDAWEYSLTGERELVVYGAAKVTGDGGASETVEIRAQYSVTEGGKLALSELRVGEQVITV